METSELLKGIATANQIESKLFDVVKLQLHPNIEGFISPNNYGLYKGTGGNALGVVGVHTNLHSQSYCLTVY